MFAKASLRTLFCALLLQACSPTSLPTTQLEPTASAEPTVAASQEATAVPMLTATLQPTVGPTATVWPPTFTSWTLQDIRQLDSFIVTVNEKNTISGELTELTHTIGYLKEPYTAYYENKHPGGVNRTFVVDEWTYELTASGDWYISAGSTNDVFFKADIPAMNTEKLSEARFVEQEEYQAIPAYHFVLDPVNSTEANASVQLEGDLYLAQEGNYVLYSHWKETSRQEGFTQEYEVTTSLSSINQLSEIELPADMTEMAAAVKLPAEMVLPLPGNSTVNRMIRYEHGIGVDLYYFTDPDVSVDAFLDFYRNLPPADGWEVTHVGHVSLHEADCEFTRECVMISKGSTQVILYYSGGSLRAEFDWPHLYTARQ